MYTEETNSPGFISRLKHIIQGTPTNTDTIGDTLSKTVVNYNQNLNDLKNDSGLTFEEWRKQVCLKTVDLTENKTTHSKVKPIDLDIRFAESFNSLGGKFIYCSSAAEAVSIIKEIKQDENWGHIFAWENEIKDLFAEYGFQKKAVGFNIETSDAAISLCDSLVADKGQIVFNPKQSSRRRLPCFPKTHIVLADVRKLEENLTEALEKFHLEQKYDLPSVMDLSITDNRHFFDSSKLVLNAQGTNDVWVILIDENIPPTNRL